MVDHLIAARSWQQITAMARMPLLAAPLEALAVTLAIALAAARGPETSSTLARSVTGGWLGGIPGAATLLLFQLGYSGGQGSYLLGESLGLLEQNQNMIADEGMGLSPDRLGDVLGSHSRPNRSLNETHAESTVLSRGGGNTGGRTGP